MVIDTLNNLICRAVNNGILQRITTRHMASSISLYADDVVIFFRPDKRDLTAIRELLCIFGATSWDAHQLCEVCGLPYSRHHLRQLHVSPSQPSSAPLRIKLFIWLTLLGRCWTADRLARHGLPQEPSCLLCDQELEMMQRLLAGCSFSRQVWHDVLSWCCSTARLPGPDDDFISWISSTLNDVPSYHRRGLASLAILSAFWLWKHRNRCLFNGDQPSASRAAHTILEEACTWARAGAKGLAIILPET